LLSAVKTSTRHSPNGPPSGPKQLKQKKAKSAKAEMKNGQMQN